MVAPRLPALVIVLCALLAAGPAQAKFDPTHRWRTIRTQHFSVHFHEGCDELAGRTALIAEEVHALLWPRVGWSPRTPTHLIIADDTDDAGGWATPYPYNQILITPTPPLGQFGLGTTHHEDWLRLVITHEYTHLLQLDMAARLPLALRAVLGRVYFPNSLQPQWLVEGLATFEETELTTGGRGRSPGSAMILRMAALEGVFPTLDRMAVFPDEWPAGQTPYLFGESFLRFLSERFGREKIAKLSREYGGRPLPYLVESTGRKVLGEEYRDLWNQWAARLLERCRVLERTVRARGLTPSTSLTSDGRFNGAAAWAPDGRRIAWLRADGIGFPGIWIMNADGSGRRRLVNNAFSTSSSGTRLTWSPDGRRLYYTRQEIVRGSASFNDVWAWDFDRGREVRITQGLRARDADLSPDGRTLALVTADRGLTRLSLLDLAGELPARAAERLRPLTGLSPEQFAEPRWSADGSRIALGAWMPGGAKEIRVLDRTGRLLARVGFAGAHIEAPAWSLDGGRLFFSSDSSGIYNIFSWDAQTSAVAQVTNVIGGAFAPAPSPDGHHLCFTDYTARGYDLRVMELAPPEPPPQSRGREEGPASLLRGANDQVRESPQRSHPAVGTGTAAAPSAYSPLDTILPHFWIPWASSSATSGTLAGLITGGQDVLQRHRYTLTGLYGPESGRLMHWLDYAYDGLRPTLRLSSADFDRTYGGFLRDARGDADYTERFRSLGADVELDFPGRESSRAISVGYRYRELSRLTALPPWPEYDGVLPATGPLGSGRIAFVFSNAHRQPLSISPAGGRRVEFHLEHFQRGFGSEHTFSRAAFDWSEYLSLPAQRHVLAARLFIGGANGGPPQQGLFALGGNDPGAVEDTAGDLPLLLRGYRPNAFRGENAFLASLEYRFPVLEIGRGGISLPLFFRRLHGALFIDAGEAWTDGGFRAGDLHTGVGAEIRLDLSLSYFLPVTVRLGIAAGLDDGGGIYPTLGIWIPQGLPGAAAARQNR